MLELIWHLRIYLQMALLLALVLLALWRGAGPERWSALVFVGLLIVDRLYHQISGRGALYGAMDIGHFCMDLVATVAFVAIALRANRIYPLWLAGLQVTAVISHIIRAISPAIAGGAYSILMILPSYFQIVVFGVGIVLHLRRIKKQPHYRSWLTSSPRSRGQEQQELP